mgnify:CR=1 FL=1
MGKSTFEKNGGYFIDGVAYMDCKITGEPVPNVSTEAVSVIGSRAVLGMVGMPKEKPKRVSTGRPAGWHFMNEFVDKDGNVFHKGKEQPDLKGTLPPTKVKPRKKKKKLSADEKLYKDLANWKKRKKAKRKQNKK